MIKGMALLVLGSSLSLYAANSVAAVGRTPGQFAVSPTGSAQYSIPIGAPPGPHGVQPHIALTYDSRQGNGYVGVGWSIGGLSSIYRCNLTIAQDGIASPVALATSDGYCMDGGRLRLTGGTYGTAGSTYQTEITNFMNVVAYGSAGNGPAYWQATDRNGWVYTYGQGGTSSNAQVLASGSTTAMSWQLNEVQDPAGNSITINYSVNNVSGTVVPQMISWGPTSAGASSYNYTMTFAYGTTGSVYGYVGGTSFNNTNLLSSIAIAYQGAVQTTYSLSYANPTASSRLLLSAVQECAGTGTSNCLAPTHITWQAGGTGLGSATAVAGSVVSAAYDVNGDGRNDLLMVNSAGAVLLALGGNGGYGNAVSTGLTSSSASPMIADIDGSGVASVIVAGSDDNWHYYKGWNGSAFAQTGSTGLAVASFPAAVLADVDGDGRADLVYLGSDGFVHVRLNTSTGGTVSFSSTDIDSQVPMTSLTNPHTVSMRGLHFWGDSQEDVIGMERFCSQPNGTACSAYGYTTSVMHFNGSTFVSQALSTTSNPLQIVDYADYNDDGCTDILTTTQLMFSTCNGGVSAALSLPTGASGVGGLDWNGDGRRDVLISQSSGTLGVLLSTGGGLSSTVINTAYPTNVQYVTAPNPTGDGQDGLIAVSSPSSVTYSLHASPGAPPDLLAQVIDGYGNSVTPSYVSLAQSNYTPSSDATYPYRNYIGPRYVVSEAVFSDPSNLGATYNQSFWYYGGWANLQGRGFQAFNERSMIDSRNGLHYLQYYERSFPESGMDYEDEITNSSGQPISEVLRTPAVTTLGNAQNQEQYFPYFSNVTTQQWEVGGAENGDLITTTSVDTTYDNYGNALTVNTTVTDNDPGSPYLNDTWTTTVTNTPEVDTTHGCLGLLTQTQIVYSATLGNSVTRTRGLTPDTTHCRYTQIITEPNSSAYQVTEALTFDGFGNIATDTVTGANMPSSPASRVTSMNWGSTGQFLTSETVPTGTTANPTTATISWSYASAEALTFGVPDSMTDANGITTHWSYDAFGRKTQESRPDDTSSQWVWSLCSSNCGWSNSVYQIAQSTYPANGSSALRTDTNSYDPVDRVTQTTGPTVTGALATVQTLYNSLGSVAQQSLPFLAGATVYQQTSNYDLMNRPLSIWRPINATNSTLQTTSFLYAGRKTTVMDANGNPKILISDVTGKLRETTDAVGYSIIHSYDAAGSRTGTTDSAGQTLLNNVTVAYGLKPFVTAAHDADLGAWSYTYDSLGEKIGWTDAKGQSFSMSYDAASRPSNRTEPDLTTTWTWGTSPGSDNVGKLASVTAASTLGTYQESYAYDSLSRPTSTVISIPGDQSYTYTKSYNPTTGRLGTLAYPVSASGYQLSLNYTYSNGLLSALTDGSTGTVYWSANASNARGQVTEETLGNEVVTTRNFDAVTGWLQSIAAGEGSGSTALQNSSYLYDEAGNLSQQQDNNRGLTENFYYDNDYRLSYSTLNGTQNLSLTYAANGNITSRSDLGGGTTWTYDPVHLHAATQTGTGGYSFAYDANGNATSRNGYTNTWTSYNYPSGVNSAGESATFFYGPNRQRFKTIYTGSIGTETTYHVGRLLEKVANANGSGVTDWRYYIKAGNELVGVYSTQAGAMRYAIADSQGGIATLSGSGQSCPSGYTLSGSSCTETTTQAATASDSCPSGYTLSGSSCVDASSVAATAHDSCPSGYSLSGTNCSETVTTAATATYSCPSGYSLSGTTCSITNTRSATLSCGGTTPKICGNGTWTCPSGWALSGTTCHQTVTQAATVSYSCPSGYTLSGTTCSETLTQAANVSYTCPTGYTLSGSTCNETLTASATVSYSCPSGYTLSGTTCSETLTVAASGSAASVLVAESFAAFGNRRSGETWSEAPSSADDSTINGVSRWGYTGQTQLGVSMGLNHLNGRIQDAITGRFLSPDPHVTDPTNAQNYNRYSYVLNNPLSYTDPSGFCASQVRRGRKGFCINGGADINFDDEANSMGDAALATLGGSDDSNTVTDGTFTMTDGSGDDAPNPADATPAQPSSQSQDSTQAQSQTSTQSGQPIDMSPSADGLAPVVVTGNAAQSPQLAQVIDPVPILGVDDEFLDPLEAARQGKPFDPRSLGRQPNYGTGTQQQPQEPATDPSMTPPMPQGVPQGGFWLQFWYVASKFFNNFFGIAPAAPPICTAPICQA